MHVKWFNWHLQGSNFPGCANNLLFLALSAYTLYQKKKPLDKSLRHSLLPKHLKSRVVTKISSCRINTTSRRGIKRLGISFGSIFLLFSNKSSQGPLSQQPGKIPGPRLLMTTLEEANTILIDLFSLYAKLQHIHHVTACVKQFYCI